MNRLATSLALTLLLIATATTDAATRKKPHARAGAERAPVAVKQPRHRVTRPAPPHQQWPTSFSDGSFRYGD